MKELFITFSYFSKRQRFFFLDLFLLRQDMLSAWHKRIPNTYKILHIVYDLVEYVFTYIYIAKVVSISLWCDWIIHRLPLGKKNVWIYIHSPRSKFHFNYKVAATLTYRTGLAWYKCLIFLLAPTHRHSPHPSTPSTLCSNNNKS